MNPQEIMKEDIFECLQEIMKEDIFECLQEIMKEDIFNLSPGNLREINPQKISEK